jgi:hypothetical protein
VGKTDETIQAERTALAADVLRRFGRLRMQVHGESMLPVLWPRDVVEFVRCSIADVRPGEIVLARRGGQFYVHRFVTRCHPNGFLLRGDSMPAADPAFPDESLLGRLVSRGGHESNGRPPLQLRPWSWALGRLIAHSNTAHRLVLKLYASWRAIRRLQGKDDPSFGAAAECGVR